MTLDVDIQPDEELAALYKANEEERRQLEGEDGEAAEKGGVCEESVEGGVTSLPERNPNVCRHFLEGKCTKAKGCRFEHPMDHPDLSPHKRTVSKAPRSNKGKGKWGNRWWQNWSENATPNEEWGFGMDAVPWGFGMEFPDFSWGFGMDGGYAMDCGSWDDSMAGYGDWFGMDDMSFGMSMWRGFKGMGKDALKGKMGMKGMGMGMKGMGMGMKGMGMKGMGKMAAGMMGADMMGFNSGFWGPYGWSEGKDWGGKKGFGKSFDPSIKGMKGMGKQAAIGGEDDIGAGVAGNPFAPYDMSHINSDLELHPDFDQAAYNERFSQSYAQQKRGQMD